MKKVLIVPDSFKGTMSSSEICGIIEEEIRKKFPESAVISIPVADGGEGSVDSFLAAAGGSKRRLTVKGPYMEDIESFYGVLSDGETAVIEMAACAGLPLVGNRLCPGKTTTFGVGQLIADAVSAGRKKIIVGLGGSATNDFGAGAAAALGIRFFDENNVSFVPVGETLSRIARIDGSGLLPALENTEITAMCDIDNPLYGPAGAAYVFGPQKGADAEMVKFLDKQLRAAAETVKREFGQDVSVVPGAGAAGGMGGGMLAFLGARLRPGIETVLDAVNFDSLIHGADLAISGEGRLDSQSLMGKVLIGVARRTKKMNVPLIALVGDIGDDIEKIYDEGVTAVFSTNKLARPFDEIKSRSGDNLRFAADNLMRLIGIFDKRS
jgi:glycerate kinase